MKGFNIRVYGLLINRHGEVLLSDEERNGLRFTKFPGGGLDWGEGISDALVREFREELNIAVDIEKLFYLTDYFQQSAFNPNDQLISIYYLVHSTQIEEIKTHSEAHFAPGENHRWKKISELREEDLTFPIDRIVAQKLHAAYEKGL